MKLHSPDFSSKGAQFLKARGTSEGFLLLMEGQPNNPCVLCEGHSTCYPWAKLGCFTCRALGLERGSGFYIYFSIMEWINVSLSHFPWAFLFLLLSSSQAKHCHLYTLASLDEVGYFHLCSMVGLNPVGLKFSKRCKSLCLRTLLFVWGLLFWGKM